MRYWFLQFGLGSLDFMHRSFNVVLDFSMEFRIDGKIHTFNIKEFSNQLINIGKSLSGIILVGYNGYSAYKLVKLYFEKRRNKIKVENAFKNLSKNK